MTSVRVRAARRVPVVGVFAAILALLAGVLAPPVAAPAAAQTATVNWIVWTPPSSYPEDSTSPGSGYDYATTAEGVLTLPSGATVYVLLTGEIVDPGVQDTSCSEYCGASGFTSNGTTRPDYWQTYPVSGDGAAFTSANVPFGELPPNGDHIGLIGAPVSDGGNPTQRLQFFSDAARTNPTSVSNIVMLIGSMGNGGNPATWDFTQDVIVLSDNEFLGGSGLVRAVKSPGGTGADFQVTGAEGAGTIQFLGSFTELEWTVSAPEIWASWNLGATSASPFPAAAPAASRLALDCRPDPVRAGELVTCDVTGGDPGIDILWRASIDGAFAGTGVTLDRDGRGTFTFLAPRDADGRTILVELVDWNVAATVGVVGTALPARIPAGEGPAGRASAAGLLSLALAAAALLGRRLTVGVPERV
jgi:hypothetical protein